MNKNIGIREALHLKFGIPKEDMWAEFRDAEGDMGVKTVHIYDRGNVDRQAVEGFLPSTDERIIWQQTDEEKEICKYAIPMKPPYQFPFACAVMYECRYDGERNRGGKRCVRYEIGRNMEKAGQELRGRRIVKNYDDIRKALEDPAVKEIVIRKHASLGKTEELLDMIGAACEMGNE